MERFTQLMWTPENAVLGEVQSIDSVWEPQEYPDISIKLGVHANFCEKITKIGFFMEKLRFKHQ